jgi:diacylglycerol kinase family enzyme
LKEDAVKVLCLVNPKSGGKSGSEWFKALHSLKQGFAGELRVESVFECSLENLLRAQQSARGYDVLVVCGGDGTVSSLLPYLLEQQVPVCLVPLGTGNDLARELELESRTPQGVVDRISGDNPWPLRDVTVWKAVFGENRPVRYFVNYLSFGLDGEVVRYFSNARKRFRWIPEKLGVMGNRLLYTIGAVKHVGGEPLRGLQISSTSSGSFEPLPPLRTVLFSNIRSVMGLASSHPKSSPFDEELEATVLPTWRHYAGLFSPVSPWQPIYYDGSAFWRIAGLSPGAALQADGESFRYDGESGILELMPAGHIRLM